MAINNEQACGDKILQNLECPFTWGMEAIAEYRRDKKQYPENDDEEFLPFLKLTRKIMSVYVGTHVKEDSAKMLDILEKCDKDIADLEKSADSEISLDVLKYVLQATQCFVYQKYEMNDKLKETLGEVKDVKFASEKDQSTLVACRGIGWSKYYQVGPHKAEKFIRRAIAKNPKCALWYFVLGKTLRQQRRDKSIAKEPSWEEVDNFERAYKLSTDLVYEMFLAQAYREKGDTYKAKEMHEKVFKRNPKSTTLLLRLSLGFIRLLDFKKAKICLDNIGKRSPNNMIYLHYYGSYHMKQKQYELAIHYFKKAVKGHNLAAEKEYIICLLRNNKHFAITEYLVGMLKKYENCPDNLLQSLTLDLAFCYWRKKNNIKEAVNYFLRAIEIDPEAKCFRDYFDYAFFGVKNVYDNLAQRFLPDIHKNKTKFSKETLMEAEKLGNYCNKYYSSKSSTNKD